MSRNNATTHPRVKSKKGQRIIIMLYKSGFPKHRISGLFDVNLGRISEAYPTAKKKQQRR